MYEYSSCSCVYVLLTVVLLCTTVLLAVDTAPAMSFTGCAQPWYRSHVGTIIRGEPAGLKDPEFLQAIP